MMWSTLSLLEGSMVTIPLSFGSTILGMPTSAYVIFGGWTNTITRICPESCQPLEGCLPDSWKMKYELQDDKAVLLANDASRFQCRVHAVLFFVAAAAVHDDQEMAIVKEAFQMVKKTEYQPVVVLSQADMRCTECNNKTLSEYPALIELNNKAATALGIAPQDVVHGVNYTDTITRDFEIDRLTYKILDMALHNACNFCQVARKLKPVQDLISEGFEDAGNDLDFGTEI